SEMPQLQEFEELIGERIKPEIFHTEGDVTLEMEPEVKPEQDLEVQTPAVDEDDFFEAPFEEKGNTPDE
ncbi:MAG TPA: hypothetical protein VLH08_15540, partial [Acidobacteriota bacterium]|nr:hypothetical protein [Acidobacteriota bacterium]